MTKDESEGSRQSHTPCRDRAETETISKTCFKASRDMTRVSRTPSLGVLSSVSGCRFMSGGVTDDTLSPCGPRVSSSQQRRQMQLVSLSAMLQLVVLCCSFSDTIRRHRSAAVENQLRLLHG